MGLLRKLLGGGDGDRPEEAHDAGLQEFLHHGSVQPGTPTPGGGGRGASTGAIRARTVVTEDDVGAAFGAGVVSREPGEDGGDEDVLDAVFHLGGDDGPQVRVFVCDHTGRPGMAEDDESCWRDLGVERELQGLGDSAFVNQEGTLFARLGDRCTIQILPPGEGPTDESVDQCRVLARSILDRLDRN